MNAASGIGAPLLVACGKWAVDIRGFTGGRSNMVDASAKGMNWFVFEHDGLMING